MRPIDMLREKREQEFLHVNEEDTFSSDLQEVFYGNDDYSYDED